MGFWGVEVKPSKPFIHAPDNGKRLHISHATLGAGSSTDNSVVQCHVGNSTPVLLCSLFPGNREVSQIHVEFEETVEVVFSVIGARSVHLVGYYLDDRSSHRADESEPHGENVAKTESERSKNDNDEDDQYDDSFIDHDDPDTTEVEKMNDEKERENCKGRGKRLSKRSQVIDPDDEDRMPISSFLERVSAGKRAVSEADEKCEMEKTEKSEQKVKDNGKGVIVSKKKAGAVAVESKREDKVQDEDKVEKTGPGIILAKREILKQANDGNVDKLKKRRKKYANEKEKLDADCHLSCKHKPQPNESTLQNVLVTDMESQMGTNDEGKSTLPDMLVTDRGAQEDTNNELVEDRIQDENKVEKTGQDVPLAKKENQEQANDGAILPRNSNLLPTQLDPEIVTTPKRKRKHESKRVHKDSYDQSLSVQDEHDGATRKRTKKGGVNKKIGDTNSGSHDNALKGAEGKQDECKSDSLELVVSVKKERSSVHPEEKGD